MRQSLPHITPPSTSLDAGRYYVSELAWSVFPTRGKQPIPRSHGHRDATTRLDRLERWYTKHSEDNVAVATGMRSGVVVLDVDAGEGRVGVESLEQLIDEIGLLPETVTQRTPRGGLHYFFAPPRDGQAVPCSASRLGKDLDIRGDGGYVLLPPSRVDGKPYEWINSPADVPLAEMPPELLERTRAGYAPTLGRSREILQPGEPDPRHYVPVICGCEIDARGFALCPDPRHADREPTLKVNRATFTCYRCNIKGRARQLAAMSLGLGEPRNWRLELTLDEKLQADELLAELGIR
jgi:hypothetical protein